VLWNGVAGSSMPPWRKLTYMTLTDPSGKKRRVGWIPSPKPKTTVSKTVVSDCGPRTAAEDASALRILKPLEFDLRPISSLLATQAFNPNGHLLICTGVTIEAQRASDVND
jgi:hypothetical protein